MTTTSLSMTPEDRLRAAGQRVTGQRLLLIRLLDQSERHLDAEALYERARQEMPEINLSTVYRTLAVLKDAGLVEQRYFARDHGREFYEATGTVEHYHFTCLNCGRVSSSPRRSSPRSALSCKRSTGCGCATLASVSKAHVLTVPAPIHEVILSQRVLNSSGLRARASH